MPSSSGDEHGRGLALGPSAQPGVEQLRVPSRVGAAALERVRDRRVLGVVPAGDRERGLGGDVEAVALAADHARVVRAREELTGVPLNR